MSNRATRGRYFRRLFASLFLIASLAGAHRATAGEAASTVELPYSLVLDGGVTAGALVFWLGSEVGKGTIAPSTCRWCDTPAPLDRGVRGALRWNDPHAAILPSNLAAMALAPAAAVGLMTLAAQHDGRVSEFGVNLLLIAQATALAGDLNQLVKFTVGRRRPFATAGLPNPDGHQGPRDSNLSFYSGHTSLAFAVAASAGTIATMRRYRWAPLVFIAGGVIGLATAYFRIAADQHYLSDVLTGAVVGTAVGAGVPYLFHRPRSGGDGSGALTVSPVGGGATVTYARIF